MGALGSIKSLALLIGATLGGYLMSLTIASPNPTWPGLHFLSAGCASAVGVVILLCTLPRTPGSHCQASAAETTSSNLLADSEEAIPVCINAGASDE